jgi:prepilin-type N-terminal cleavage/methylation domain-containing protein
VTGTGFGLVPAHRVLLTAYGFEGEVPWPTPATGALRLEERKQALLDAAQDAVQDAQEKATAVAAGKAATLPHRGYGAGTRDFAVGIYILAIRPTWFFTPAPPPESVQIQEASVRLMLVREASRFGSTGPSMGNSGHPGGDGSPVSNVSYSLQGDSAFRLVTTWAKRPSGFPPPTPWARSWATAQDHRIAGAAVSCGRRATGDGRADWDLPLTAHASRLTASGFRLPAHGSRGFTIVELLTVIIVLGLLSGIAILKYLDLRNQARAAEVAGDFRTVMVAAYNYYSDHNDWRRTVLRARLHRRWSSISPRASGSRNRSTPSISRTWVWAAATTWWGSR